MADLKEDYYFNFVPEREKTRGSKIDWETYQTLLSVVLTYSTMEARLSRFLSQWDLFPSAFNLLAILDRTDGEGMHLSRISDLLAVSRANVTGLIDVLARKKLVERVPSTSDRRVRLAQLTPEGSRLISEILPAYYEFNEGLCASFSQSEIETMTGTLTRLRAIMNDRDTADAAETANN